jgi:Uncharacterized conserved protein
MSPHFAGRGTVWHQRHAPKAHGFKYATAMALLDLDQLDQLGKVLKVNKRALLSFRSTRHLCDDAIPSGQVARDWASNELDHDVSGRVLLLTNPHILGVGFNPLSGDFLRSPKKKTPGRTLRGQHPGVGRDLPVCGSCRICPWNHTI